MVISFVSHSVALFALFSILWSQGSGFPAEGSDPGSRTPRNTDGLFASEYSKILGQLSARQHLESLIGGDTRRTRRQTDGYFAREYKKLLDQMAARKYLETLMSITTSNAVPAIPAGTAPPGEK